MSDDVICGIVRRRYRRPWSLRTNEVIAFLDHRPVFKGHVLVAPDRPRRHSARSSRRTHDSRSSRRRSRSPLRSWPDWAAQGTFVAVNNVVSQSVPHLHVHVVPRTRGDGLRGFFWPRTKYADGEMTGYAQLIRENLDGVNPS